MRRLAALVLACLVGCSSVRATVGYSSLPRRAIVMWSGTLANIPVGWQLCDGTNGTPDLRNSFAKCVGASEEQGGTGGATTANYTPAGTVAAPTFTGSAGTVPAEVIAWPVGTPTAANESAHTHSVTGAGTNVAGTFVIVGTNHVSLAGSSPACTSFNGTTLASGNNTVSVPAQTFTGSAVTSSAGSAHTHVLSWPAGVPTAGTASFTPAGTNSAPAFTGTAATIATQPPFYKLVFIMQVD